MKKKPVESPYEEVLETHLLTVSDINIRPSWDPYCSPYISMVLENDGTLKMDKIRVLLPFAKNARTMAEKIGSSVLLLGHITQWGHELPSRGGSLKLRVLVKKVYRKDDRSLVSEAIIRVGSSDGVRWFDKPEHDLTTPFEFSLQYPFAMGIPGQ